MENKDKYSSPKLKCSKCGTTYSLWWAKLEGEITLCSDCYQKHKPKRGNKNENC